MRARIMLALDVFDLHAFIVFVCMFWLYNFLCSGCCSEGLNRTTPQNDDVSLAQGDHLAHPAHSAHLAIIFSSDGKLKVYPPEEEFPEVLKSVPKLLSKNKNFRE